MNDRELNDLLKSASVPEESKEFREELAARISRTFRQRKQHGERVAVEPRRFDLRGWAMATAAVTVVVLAVSLAGLSHLRNKSADGFARAEKCFREIEALFPNQVRAMVFGTDGPRLEMSEKADVPNSPPVYLKICGPQGCQEIVTFSGQQVLVNGELCDVLLDSAGDVLLVGRQLIWSSNIPERAVKNYRIEARSFSTAS